MSCGGSRLHSCGYNNVFVMVIMIDGYVHVELQYGYIAGARRVTSDEEWKGGVSAYL